MPSVTRPLQLLASGFSWLWTGARTWRKVLPGVSQPEGGYVTTSACWCDGCIIMAPTACGWAVS